MSERHPPALFNENLALGWFACEAPEDPGAGGNVFVIHAAEGDNGELWARVSDRPLRAFRQLQNLHFYYLVILREKGAAYYVSSVPDAQGVAPFPRMRPIAIDPFDDAPNLYAGLYQAVLGQMGFRVDTRVHAVNVLQNREMSVWYGTAHCADSLIGKGDLHGVEAEVGGAWACTGRYVRTEDGARADQAGAHAVLDPGTPSGLVHALVEGSRGRGEVGIMWRHRDQENYWMLQLSHARCQLVLVKGGKREVVASDAERGLGAEATCSVQILDGHGQFGLYLNGERLFDAWFSDDRLQDATGVGLHADQAGAPWVRAFEAHAASVPMPASIRLDPPWVCRGRHRLVADRFGGAAGDLAGRLADEGNVTWVKTLGQGAIELTGAGQAKVRASLELPNPGRTAYTVPWTDSGFADLETTITPPGTAKGQGEKCRAGLIFWQDKRNYLTFTSWLDDAYEGSSIALFSHLNGFEELYDAIWTMLSNKITWGEQFRLRIVFDGLCFTVHLNGEPVLHRALTDLYPRQRPLRITRVGLVVNWEWGDDTGSLFDDFVAATRGEQPW